ncbi:GNAT family N-acetyltransferase [Vibrio sp. PP-XX7]
MYSCDPGGGLSTETVDLIQQGVHRPKGQLVPTTLINQLGFSDAGALRCCRIMRIVVHPQLQRKGLGSQLLSAFIKQFETDYFATSFGASEALLHFWHHHDFHPIKLGSRRDQSSGCYSILMIRQCLELWFDSAKQYFSYYFMNTLKTEFVQLEPAIVRQLLSMLSPLSWHHSY